MRNHLADHLRMNTSTSARILARKAASRITGIGHHVIVPQLGKSVSLAGVFLFPEKVTQIKCPLSYKRYTR